MTQPLAFSDPYPFLLPHAEMKLVGKWVDGGRALLQLDPAQPPVQLELPAAEFAILGLLVRHSLSTLAWESSPSDAFLDNAELLAGLRRLFGDTEPERVAKGIWKVRQRLRAALGVLRHQQQEDPTLQIIENQTIGYRVSLHPQNLHLRVLDDYRMQPNLPMRGAAPTLPPRIESRG